MRRELEFTQPYLEELDAVLQYVELTFSPKVAGLVKRRIDEAVQTLITLPNLGVEMINAPRPNIRKLIIAKKSIVLYEVRPGAIRLLNIYDSRMDWQTRI